MHQGETSSNGIPDVGELTSDMHSGLTSLSVLADYTSDLIGFCDAGGRLRFLNRAGRHLIGINDDEAVPSSLANYVAPEEIQRLTEEVIPVATSQGVWRGKTTLVNSRTQNKVVVERATYAARNREGALTGFVSVMNVVDEPSQIGAEHVVQAGRTLAHDLNNLISTIVLSLAVIGDQGDSERTMRAVTLCQRAADRSSELLRAFLEGATQLPVNKK